MEHQLSEGDCREEHKEEGEDKHTILTDGACENQRDLLMDHWTRKEKLLMGAHNSMLVK